MLEELERQPGILRLSPETRTAASRLVADLERYVRARQRAAGRRGALRVPAGDGLARPARRGRVAWRPRRRCPNVARFFDIVRAQSALLADDRAMFVARHLQTLIEAGDDPPTADLDPDADAVAVLTVHKAKGLEFPFVYLPGLSPGGSRRIGRREPLGAPARRSCTRRCPRATTSSRRSGACSTSAMTRARDELVLTHAADYGGAARAPRLAVRARGARPAVAAARRRRRGRPRAAGAARRARAHRRRQRSARAGAVDEPLTLSFYAIDDYLTCPLKYKYAHVLRVPLAAAPLADLRVARSTRRSRSSTAATRAAT